MTKRISCCKISLISCFIIVFISFSELCVATIKVQGIVKDSQTSEALVFASLGLKNYPMGTCTNMSGEFQFIVDDSLANEMITVSIMGYESREFKISDMQNDYFEILLDPKTIQLEEVLVLPTLTGEELLKRVIKHHSKNYPFGFSYYETFFRDLVRNDSPAAMLKNNRLTEAAINIEDFGLDSSRDPKFLVHEIRNSFNYVETSNQLKNFLFTGIQNPVSWMYKYNNIISRYQLKKLLKDKCYSKEIIGMTLFEGKPIYILELRQRYFKFFGATMDVTGGYNNNVLYVNATNWAVQEARQLIMSMEDTSKFILKVELKMQEFKGSYYLKLLDYDGYIPDELSKLDKDHKYKHKASILVNQVVVDRKSVERVRLRNAMKTDQPLWNAEYKYNPEFWNNYNILLDQPLDTAVIKDLEREAPLKNQFNDQGLTKSKK